MRRGFLLRKIYKEATRRFKPSVQAVLLLNATYEPLAVVSWQKAFVLWFQDKVDIIAERDQELRSAHKAYKAPAVVRLKNYVKPQLLRKVRLTRDHIFMRDEYHCQYCKKKFATKELTIDHVHPVSRGGAKSWENLVAACYKCNHKKSNRTPKEAGMNLKKEPIELKWTPAFENKSIMESEDQDWAPYLNYDSL